MKIISNNYSHFAFTKLFNQPTREKNIKKNFRQHCWNCWCFSFLLDECYKKHVRMIRYTTITNCRLTHGTVRKATDHDTRKPVKLRGYIFQKLLLAWKFSCINKNCFFVKVTDTFGHISVWTTYTSHIDHFTPQRTAFERSAACLSVFLKLLPGLIPLTMLWHAGWTLEKTICMNMTYNHSTTIFRSIFAQNV